MTPTSEERRKVASALRGDPNDTLIPQSRDGFEGMTYREAAFRFWDMCRRVRDAANVDIAYSTTSVLADLIDPTCHPVPSDDGRFSCSECGAHLGAVLPAIGAVLPPHCPNCGARVVSGDGTRD